MSPAWSSARVEGRLFPLIDQEDLARALTGVPQPVVLDVRWTLAGADEPGYLAGHIPGARFVNLDTDLAGPAGRGGRHPLPDPAALQRLWRSVGIDDDSQVVVYDGSDGAPAARAWWLLRWSGIAAARVLDGGLAGWRAAGRPVAQGPEPSLTGGSVGSVVVRPGGMPTVGPDEVVDVPGGVRLLDARAANRFRGEVEPVDPVAGHIPGAVNLPYLGLLDDQRRFRTAAELAAAFAAAGVGVGSEAGAERGLVAGAERGVGAGAERGLVAGAERGVGAERGSDSGVERGLVAGAERGADVAAIASCGSGVTACVLVLAAATIGLDLALYPGSYSQWCALGREVATGG